MAMIHECPSAIDLPLINQNKRQENRRETGEIVAVGIIPYSLLFRSCPSGQKEVEVHAKPM
jgi:hypothetical protein